MAGLLFACLLSYLVGSIPSGLILGKGIWHIDLREHGSHNIGATNAWRTLGKAAGTSIFLLDFAKGALSVYLGALLVGTPAVPPSPFSVRTACVPYSWPPSVRRYRGIR